MEDFEKKWRILKKNGGAISEALGRIFTPGVSPPDYVQFSTSAVTGDQVEMNVNISLSSPGSPA